MFSLYFADFNYLLSSLLHFTRGWRVGEDITQDRISDECFNIQCIEHVLKGLKSFLPVK